jgi:hypothetical protein
MTEYYYDQVNDTQIDLFPQHSQEIPNWARSKFFILLILNFILFFLESQLQLAYINQAYFNDKNPEDIFGSVQINLAYEIVQSLKCYPPNLSHAYAFVPPNFV